MRDESVVKAALLAGLLRVSQRFLLADMNDSAMLQDIGLLDAALDQFIPNPCRFYIEYEAQAGVWVPAVDIDGEIVVVKRFDTKHEAERYMLEIFPNSLSIRVMMDKGFGPEVIENYPGVK